MKFGKTLKRVSHTPWSDKYVNYKLLKKYVKQCSNDLTIFFHTDNDDLKDHDTTKLQQLHRREFFQMLAEEARKVSLFYLQCLKEWEDRHEGIVNKIAKTRESSVAISDLVRKALQSEAKAELQTLSEELNKLRSFVLVNHLAFIKILKKYDKHVSSLAREALANGLSSDIVVGGENGSASTVCMESIMQYDFYRSPRLANLLTQVHVELATLAAQTNTLGSTDQINAKDHDLEQKEPIEEEITPAYEEKTSGISIVTESKAAALKSGITDPPTSVDDTEFMCPICLEVLCLPVVLSCSHSFCFSCLASWSMQSQKCPVCRLEHPLHPDSYTVNNTLDEFLCKFFPVQRAQKLQTSPIVAGATGNDREKPLLRTATGDFNTEEQYKKDSCSTASKPSKSSRSFHAEKVNAVKHINSIMEVSVPGSIVIFDVDDTLITNLHHPCSLTTDKGIAAYQAILARNPLYAHLSVKDRNKCTRILQCALDSKRLVESDTQIIVQQLQQMGCYVFGLTKRWSESSSETRRELLSLGMDFSNSSPFPFGRKYCDEFTESLLVDGIIYTNGHEKGPVLDRFLSQILYAAHIKERQELMKRLNDSTHEASVESLSLGTPPLDVMSPSSSSSQTANLPANIIFLDDLHENARSVLNSSTLKSLFNIPLFSCHYTAVHEQVQLQTLEYVQEMVQEYGSLSHSITEHSEMEILQYHVYHVVHYQQVISDKQAMTIISRLKQKSSSMAQKKQAQPIRLKNEVET